MAMPDADVHTEVRELRRELKEQSAVHAREVAALQRSRDSALAEIRILSQRLDAVTATNRTLTRLIAWGGAPARAERT